MIGHDEFTDERTGPWLRRHHDRDEDGRFVYDPNCRRCRNIADRVIDELPSSYVGSAKQIRQKFTEGIREVYKGV